MAGIDYVVYPNFVESDYRKLGPGTLAEVVLSDGSNFSSCMLWKLERKGK